MLNKLRQSLGVVVGVVEEEEENNNVWLTSVQHVMVEVLKNNKNEPGFVLSPLGIKLLLGMCLLGAKNETSEELKRFTCYFSRDGMVKDVQLFETLNSFTTNNTSLVLVNKILFDKSSLRTDNYANNKSIALLREIFNIQESQCDFKNDSNNEKNKINHSIAQSTRGEIVNFLSENDVTTLTKMILINAIYFKGTFKNPFDKQITGKDVFTCSNGEQVTCWFMKKRGAYLPYHSGKHFQAVDLEYNENEMLLRIVLPNEEVKNLSEVNLKQVLSAPMSSSQDIDFYLPKFALTFGSVSLKETLQNCGVKHSFDMMNANFEDFPIAELFVTDIIVKASIVVDECGTVAAFAAAAIMAQRALPPSRPCVRCNRPYLFLILNKKNLKEPLFLGMVLNPPSV